MSEKRVALVTGGSRGIGRAICVELANHGMHVLVNYTANESAAAETVAMCNQGLGSGVPMQFDVADSQGVDAAIDAIKTKYQRLDVLVNNAGVTNDGLFMRMKDEDWSNTLAINLNGAFFCTRAASRLMIKARQGRIINISSVVAEMGNPGQAAYVASKAGLIGLTKSNAKELASRGITVNAVTPGFIETDMTSKLDEKQREHHLQFVPLGRFGTTEEVAKTVVFLASPDAAYITGQVIGINGGMYM